MSKFLTPDRLLKADADYLLDMNRWNKKKEEDPSYLQKRPPLPHELSESIAAAAVPLIFGDGAVAFDPPMIKKGIKHDLGITAEWLKRPLMGAVKGSGMQAFASMTRSDYEADLLLWVDYVLRLMTGEPTIEIQIFDRPPAQWAEGDRLTYSTACKLFGRKPEIVSFELVPVIAA